MKRIAGTLIVSLATVAVGTSSFVSGQSGDWVRRPVRLNLGPGLYGVAVNAPADALIVPTRISRPGLRSDSPIPIAGFSPYVAIGLTNQREYGGFLFEHHLVSSVVGNDLNVPMSLNYAIGILDTGATSHLIGYCDRDTVGLGGVSNPYMTDIQIEIGGAGGTIMADVSWPIGVFVAGLQAVDPSTLLLNTTAMTGHWQVSVAALPDEICGDDADVPSVIGTGLIAFHDVAIRNTNLQTITRNAQTYISPEVELLTPGTAPPPDDPTTVLLDLRPGGLQTAAYLSNIFELDFETPWIPTGLATQAGDFPTGGWYYASVVLQDGASSERERDFMVDTGAQVSVIRSFLAGQLGLDLEEPEFTVDIVGVTGEVSQANGYYLDTFKIDASGGPIVFSNVPVVVMNLTSIEGGDLEGIVGMNLMFDRDLVLTEDFSFGPMLKISAPIVNAVPGDYDGDADVDLDDFAAFPDCMQGSGAPPEPYFPCVNAFDFDVDGDVDLADFGSFQNAFTGPGT